MDARVGSQVRFQPEFPLAPPSGWTRGSTLLESTFLISKYVANYDTFKTPPGRYRNLLLSGAAAEVGVLWRILENQGKLDPILTPPVFAPPEFREFTIAVPSYLIHFHIHGE